MCESQFHHRLPPPPPPVNSSNSASSHKTCLAFLDYHPLQPLFLLLLSLFLYSPKNHYLLFYPMSSAASILQRQYKGKSVIDIIDTAFFTQATFYRTDKESSAGIRGRSQERQHLWMVKRLSWVFKSVHWLTWDSCQGSSHYRIPKDDLWRRLFQGKLTRNSKSSSCLDECIYRPPCLSLKIIPLIHPRFDSIASFIIQMVNGIIHLVQDPLLIEKQ